MPYPITPAEFHLNDSGTPVSDTFDDVYFSVDNGMEETDYVFLKHNHLPDRWPSHTQQAFVIGETGFGTGLNFFLTWLRFREFKLNNPEARCQRLHFISFELFPVLAGDLAKSLAQFPILAPFITQFCEQFPQLVYGCHRLTFDDGSITLDLHLGDINDTISEISSRSDGIIHAWYLDGFAPSGNEAMWTEQVFQNMARLGKNDCTFSTFTAAGFVKRGLKAAGFAIEKVNGFGRKRDMLRGTLTEKPDEPKYENAFHRYPSMQTADKAPVIAIIGGGIASATIAEALSRRGLGATIYTKDKQLAAGASKNRQGGFYPLLHADFNIQSEFYSHAFMWAKQRYLNLEQAFDFDHDWCGVMNLSYKEQLIIRHQKQAQSPLWPDSLIQHLTSEQASAKAGLSMPCEAVWFPDGGWIYPASLIDSLIQQINTRVKLDIVQNTEIVKLSYPLNNDIIEYTSPQWTLTDQQGNAFEADIVIIATGYEANQLIPDDSFPIVPIRGQVSHVASNEESEQLKALVCHSGYITPANKGNHCIGATFVRGETQQDIKEAEHQANLNNIQQDFANEDWKDSFSTASSGSAGIRSTLPDHLPVVGAIPDHQLFRQKFDDFWKGATGRYYPKPGVKPGLFTLTGLGARGLCSAPLCAEILVSEIMDEPFPVSNRVLNALYPGRFLLKQLKKQPEHRDD